jgi:rhodanese-related sulfurtransferase
MSQSSSSRFPVWAVIAGIAVVVVIAVTAVLLQQNNTTLPAEISVADAAAKRNSGAFILDVRQPDEWVEYHMSDSILIPLGELETRLKDVPRDKDVVVVCRSGNRSKSGRDILLKAGFPRVTSMAGGLTEWKAQGFPTVSGQ